MHRILEATAPSEPRTDALPDATDFRHERHVVNDDIEGETRLMR